MPLCGKSLDLGWLLSRGYAVAGAELSELAVTQLFAELGVEARTSEVGKFRLFRGEKIDIFVGDMFDPIERDPGPVALPEAMRVRYAAHLKTISALAPQLVIGYVYDQTVVERPPF